MELTSKQRAYLGGCASTLDPIFQIGKASLTPEIIQALDEALEKRELIKISVLKNCADDPREIAQVIAVGPGGVVDGKEVEMYIKTGDRVITSKYSGTEIKLDGEEYTIVRQSDVLAVVE